MTPKTSPGPRVLAHWGVAAALAVLAPAVSAQDELIVVEPEHTTTYLNGGIGQTDEQYMRSVAKDWPLRLIFSESAGQGFVANVSVLVTDAQGSTWLQLQGAGPMTYARVPAGKYRVTARFKGKSETREVTVGTGAGHDVNFQWRAPAS